MRLQRLRARLAARTQTSDGQRPPTRVDRLLDSGIFDYEFYSAAVGRSFPTDRAAARHCITRGLAASLSPNPLLDIASTPRSVQQAWVAGRIGVVLGHLRAAATNDALGASIGPLFDARKAAGATEDKAAHPGGALGLFMSTARSETLLPVPDGYPGRPPSLGHARAALVDRVRRTETQRKLTGPRTTRSWNALAEVAWKERWSDDELPRAATPLVSIITPVRNRPLLVRRAIESVQQQQFSDWEMIVVDDGSTDDTADIVEELADHDARVRIIRRPAEGVGAARNVGLHLSRGRYVAFLDSDNTWRTDFLRIALRAMVDRGYSAAYAGARLVDDATGRVLYRAYEGGLDDLMVKNHIDLNTLVVERTLALSIDGFDVTLRRWIDHDFALRVAKRVPIQLLPFIACDYDDDREALDRITTTVSEAWQFVVLGKNWVDWDRLRADAGGRDHDLVSVVVPTYQDSKMTVRAVTSVLSDADTSGLAVEVVVIDNGSMREVGTQLVATFLTEPRVRYVRLPRNLNFAIGCNVGFAETRGRVVVFLNNDTVVRSGWLTSTLPHLEDPTVRGVQPLLLYPDDTVQTAGTIFCASDFLPVHFLVGHPPEDAEQMSGRPFSAVTAAALMIRAEEFASLSGFDAIFVNGMEDVDYCLRAARQYGGGFTVEASARVTHLESKTPGRGAMIVPNRTHFIERWRGSMPEPDVDRHAEMNLQVAHLASDGNRVPAARPVVIRQPARVTERTPRLRWGLKLASTPGPLGDVWGDTYLAHSLAAALRRAGQEVVTYRHGTHNSTMSYLDDVLLGIRGLDVVHPHPGKLNLLWVISHPDDVTPEELQGFDEVFAASDAWSHKMTLRSGRGVHPLYQAVDSAHLSAMDGPRSTTRTPVFVGANHDRRHRQAVHDAVEADIGLEIHGPGWESTSFADRVESRHVANDQLSALYRRHGLVLADHWPDMAANGFIANRVFDAVASGALVVSDDVDGIEDLFAGAVRVYKSIDHLRQLCSPQGREQFPSEDQLGKIASKVAQEHSFDQRASVLVEAVMSRGAPSRAKDRHDERLGLVTP